MATLTRSPAQVTPYDDQLSVLASTVPTPFPSLEETSRPVEDRHVEQTSADAEVEEKDPFADNVAAVNEDEVEVAAGSQDVLPSITYVQKSCLITLNDLLSVSSPWRSIVPDRRHSLPTDTIRSTPLDTPDPQPALQELLINLRARTPSSEMQQARPLPSDEAEMLHELRARVDTISAVLEPEDAELARTLVALLSQLHRLSVLGISSSPTLALPHLHSALPASLERHGSIDVFNALSRQLSDFQVQQHHARSRSESAGVPPVQAVEQALLWSSIDTNLETVLRLCRERAEALLPPRMAQDQLPPEYDPADYEVEGPPKYEYDFRTAPSEAKMPAQASMSNTSPHISEKMRLDLDAVTMAIDRLYDVAPQLHNQRVELKSKKRAELERARLRGEDGMAKLKEKERDLDRIVDMIGRASQRRLSDQTVVLEGGMKAQLEKARRRDLQKRQAFVSKLIEHSDAGRMHSQDASFQAPKLKDPDALLSLPEFMRESVPSALLPQPDPRTLLTLPEFVREAAPPPTPVPVPAAAPPQVRRTMSGKFRSRSMSAPGFDWLLSAGSLDRGSRSAKSSRPNSRPTSSGGRRSTPIELSIHYVAEHHESLRHVIAFLDVKGGIIGTNLGAEVPSSSTPSSSSSPPPPSPTSLILHCGAVTSSPLPLPAPVTPGPQQIRVQGTHYEVKLPAPSPPPPHVPTPLLDAAQLTAAAPTSFICASCSLPLVQGARVTRYDDLPSEHWAELVEAWMCHADQQLSAQVAQHGSGFWPKEGQALVGGSYVLFEGRVVMRSNLWVAEQPKHGEEFRTVRCICGSFAGRCQEYTTESGERTTAYRLVKYALRPVSPAAEPLRIPLSAFIVEDMAELASAHATYRFVILDEEEERPRLLIWLFKPSMRLSYAAPTYYSIPQSGVIQAAKVLYKTIGPSTVYTDLPSLLDKYPGFPQAEQLLYPMEICQRLAVLLKESNACYPEGMRTMTGLDVGWLLRA